MLLHLNHLSYRYSPHLDRVLNKLSLSIDSTRVTGLAGANGSGKTTLIRILLGQLIDYQGEYRIDDTKITDRYGTLPFRFGFGYSPETPVLDDTLTGYEILTLIADIRAMEKKAFEEELALFRHNLQIEEWLEVQKCGEYSTGMRRKLALCIAYLGGIKFAVLDEPTNGLDPLAVFGLKKIIQAKKEQGIGTLLASHILDFLETTTDDILLLKHGTMLRHGALETVMSGGKSLEAIYYSLFNEGNQ
jgi:ABC-type multidrug transport system ATPase subunit